MINIGSDSHHKASFCGHQLPLLTHFANLSPGDRTALCRFSSTQSILRFLRLPLCFHLNDINVGQIESLQSSLHTATGRVNQLQRANELLETQVKSLKIVIVDLERQQAAAAAAAADAKQLSVGRDMEMEISELKQQVILVSMTMTEFS